MTNSIRMSPEQFKALSNGLRADTTKESAVFLTAGFFENDRGCHLTVRDVMVADGSDYDFRSDAHLEMSPMFFNRAISRADKDGITVVQCHSHPFSRGSLEYSQSDWFGESTSAKTVKECLGGKPMGSLLFGPDKIAGRVWMSPDKAPVSLDELRIVGRHFKIMDLHGSPATKVDRALFDRQIRAFGASGQRDLARLRVGIVGAGGTGSAAAEQLARIGVGAFVIVDPDKFSPSNKTRMYGSDANTLALHKTRIVEDNIRSISPEADVDAVPEDVILQETLDRLKNCDIVLSCTDKHAPRSVLNELAHQFFIPVIDMGTGIDSDDHDVVGGTVRVTLCSPSLPCLYCMSIINPAQIMEESLSEGERAARVRDGYIRGSDEVPSVVSLTTLAASYAVLFLKDMLFSITDMDAGTLMVDVKSMKTMTISAPVKKDCVCVARVGKGAYAPLSAPFKRASPDNLVNSYARVAGEPVV